MKNKIVTVGFDGFIDVLTKPIKNTLTNEYFKTIEEFGQYLVSKSSVSCSIEYTEFERKLGGNMPNFAYSLACKGIEVNAIGTLGDAPEFDKLHEKCNTFSYGKEYIAQALEFDSSKIFLAQSVKLDFDPYEKISSIFDIINFTENDAFVLLNWSELSFSTKLWDDIYEKCFAIKNTDKNKFLFFDLCDIERHDYDEVAEILNIIQKYCTKRYGILSLNGNEFNILARLLNVKSSDPQAIIKEIYSNLHIDEILVHTTKVSYSCNENGFYLKNTKYVEKPVISTGSGDNFNASFLYAKLRGFDAEKCLELANLGAYKYIITGECADFLDIE